MKHKETYLHALDVLKRADEAYVKACKAMHATRSSGKHLALPAAVLAARANRDEAWKKFREACKMSFSHNRKQT